MTWQWTVLILGVLAVLVAQAYVNVLKQRTEIAARSLGISDASDPMETRLTNGKS